MIPAIVTSVVSGITSVFKGIVGLKTEQANTINKAIDTLSSTQASDAQSAQAVAGAIEAVYANGGWLERNWRPAAMWIFLILIVCRWFGYVPPHLPAHEVDLIYNFFEMGLIGYLPLRSLDKWFKGFQVAAILQKFIEKKVL